MEEKLANRLRQYVTLKSPFGPSDAAKIEDDEVAARLFDPHNKSFNALLREDLSVVIGRRGSGKTALLKSYRYQPYLEQIDGDVSIGALFNFKTYDIVIEIVPHRKFEQMQDIVTRGTRTFRPIESVVDDWRLLIGDFFLARFLGDDLVRGEEPELLGRICAYLHQDENAFKEEVRRAIWGDSLWNVIRSFISPDNRVARHEPRISQEDAILAATEYLNSRQMRAIITFDSMDEYGLGDPAFDRTVGALIRFISQFNDTHERIKLKLGLPSEIFPEVQRTSANPLKDLVSFDQVQWTAMELAQIAAYRYRLFLELYDVEHARRLSDLDLNRREHVLKFWASFFRDEQLNRYGHEEEPMTYVLRHTQLLPRQLLMILQKIAVASKRHTGGFREFKGEAVVASIEEMEPVIANEILGAFRHVYEFAETVGKAVFGNFPTIFSYDMLEDKWRKAARVIMYGRDPGFEMPHFCDMLIRMGVIGVVAGETDRYFKGRFGYNSLIPFNIGEGHELCLHPIFSRHFNASGNNKSKAVLPQGVTLEWL